MAGDVERRESEEGARGEGKESECRGEGRGKGR